jgi:hypothetical protein
MFKVTTAADGTMDVDIDDRTARVLGSLLVQARPRGSAALGGLRVHVHADAAPVPADPHKSIDCEGR